MDTARIGNTALTRVRHTFQSLKIPRATYSTDCLSTSQGHTCRCHCPSTHQFSWRQPYCRHSTTTVHPTTRARWQRSRSAARKQQQCTAQPKSVMKIEPTLLHPAIAQTHLATAHTPATSSFFVTFTCVDMPSMDFPSPMPLQVTAAPHKLQAAQTKQ